MKIKKALLTVLLALIAIFLLQLQVKAEEIDYSEYDYLLTETGVVAKNNLTGTETVIAGIKGEYTGEITVDTTNKKVTINNFTTNTLRVFDETFYLWIEGENNVPEVELIVVSCFGNGKITTDGSYITSNFIGYSYNNSELTYYLGDYIDDSVDTIEVNLGTMHIDSSGKILDSVAQRICEVIPYVSGGEISLNVPNNSIIPASIFAKLKSCNNTYLCMWDDSCQFTFHSLDIENTNVDFKIGVEFSSNPIGNMTVLERGQRVEYIKFNNTGSAPGKVEIHMNRGGAEEGEPDESCYIIIESFNENTKSYEYFDQVADPYKTLSMLGKGAILYPQGGYAIHHVVPALGDGESEAWCVETEVDSLVWTEEDINKILADIEETRNNTTEKQLYVHVPTGSKVPAKIFEASNGIDISIISEDGIWAEFSGGNYKAIDYVAGGTISNKAIDGMVNVGENTIVYLSLKHEGQLPASCVISYIFGSTDVLRGAGGFAELVETKLYYFNKDLQKYELCGTGEMDLAYDYYSFKIDHCSSYVMSEEELPAEFVIASATDDKKEEVKEETKKEESKKDTTKAPGSIPYAGGTTIIVLSMVMLAVVGIVAYIKNKNLRGI